MYTKAVNPKQRPGFFFWPLFLFIFLSIACKQNKSVNDTSRKQVLNLFSLNVEDSLMWLVPILDSIREVDQQYRSGILPDRNGHSEILPSEWLSGNKKQEIHISDSLNANFVCSVIDQYGWLGPKEIGFMGNQTMFLVIQHADLATQEKYLPKLKAAFLSKKATPFQLAMLEDRISYRKKHKQVYGTQSFYSAAKKKFFLLPLIDPVNAENRRLSIGIDTAQYNSYLGQFNLKWNLHQYVEDSTFVSTLLAEKK